MSPLRLEQFVEKRLIDDLLALEGISCVSLISPDGFILESNGTKTDLTSIVNLFDLRPKNTMVTTVGENGTIIGIRLESSHILAVLCEVSSNLGRVRLEMESIGKTLSSIL